MEILNITHKVKSIEEIDSENKIINVEKIITEQIDVNDLLSRKKTIERSLLGNELSRKQMIVEKDMIDELIEGVGKTEEGIKIEKEISDWKTKNKKIINKKRLTQLI